MGMRRFAWVPVLLGAMSSCGVEDREFDAPPTGGASNADAGAAGGPNTSGGSSGAKASGGAAGSGNAGEAGAASDSTGGSDEPSAGGDAGAGADGSMGDAGGSAGDAGDSTGDAGSGGHPSAGAGAGGASDTAAGSGGAPGMSGAGGMESENEQAGAGGEAAAVPEPQPFVCGDPLPAVTFPTVLTSTGTPPSATGGEITEGLYVLTEVIFYGSYSSVPGDVLAMRPGYFHRRHTTYSTSGSALTGYEEIGTYATTGQAMARDVTACGLGSAPGLWKFTATASQIQLFWTEGSTTRIDTFELQP